MRHSVKSFIGFTLGATDGEIGKVKEFYFDDDTWTIRYLIVDTGNWLYGRVVLISPEALLTPDWEHTVFPVTLTKELIKNSPDINTNLPVSRQEEIKLHAYYPWVAYWGGGYYGGGSGPIHFGSDPLAGGLPPSEFEKKLALQAPDDDPHLRSTNKVTGYTIHAKDGEIGDVEDFILGDDTWNIDYLLIDTGKWLPGKKVLLSPKLINEINWEDSQVTVETTLAFIEGSTEYDPAHLIHVIPENQLHFHYEDLVSKKE